MTLGLLVSSVPTKALSVASTICATSDVGGWSEDGCHKPGRKPGYLLGIKICGICSFFMEIYPPDENWDDEDWVVEERCRHKNSPGETWWLGSCPNFKLKSKLQLEIKRRKNEIMIKRGNLLKR